MQELQPGIAQPLSNPEPAVSPVASPTSVRTSIGGGHFVGGSLTAEPGPAEASSPTAAQPREAGSSAEAKLREASSPAEAAAAEASAHTSLPSEASAGASPVQTSQPKSALRQSPPGQPGAAGPSGSSPPDKRVRLMSFLSRGRNQAAARPEASHKSESAARVRCCQPASSACLAGFGICMQYTCSTYAHCVCQSSIA